MKLKRIFLILSVVTFGLISTFSGINSSRPETIRSNGSFSQEEKSTNSLAITSNESVDDYGVETNNLKFSINTFSETTTSKSVSIYVSLNEDAITDNVRNFYVGYYEESDKQFPAKLLYTIKYSNGKEETKISPINKKNTNGKYEGIGDYLGTDTLNTFCDIDCPYGSTLDESSIKLINVFAANIVKNESGNIISRLPDYDHPYYVSATLASYVKNYSFNDFLNLEYQGVTNFANYSSIRVTAKSNGAEMYKKLKASSYKKYLTQIESGEYYIRTRLSFGGDSFFVFTMKDGTTRKESTISSNIEFSNAENTAHFLVHDIPFDQIENFQLYNTYVLLGIYNVSARKELQGNSLAVSIRFPTIDLGFVDVKDADGKVIIAKTENPGYVSVDAILIISMLAFAIIYFGILVFSYFYLKKKNANDEFKKMRTGQYYKTGILGYVQTASMLLAIELIINRGFTLSNSFAVYNPLDVFIIIFGLIALLLGGYFIKYFWNNFKASQEKKRVERLKLNQDVIDDGTILIVADKK